MKSLLKTVQRKLRKSCCRHTPAKKRLRKLIWKFNSKWDNIDENLTSMNRRHVHDALKLYKYEFNIFINSSVWTGFSYLFWPSNDLPVWYNSAMQISISSAYFTHIYLHCTTICDKIRVHHNLKSLTRNFKRQKVFLFSLRLSRASFLY